MDDMADLNDEIYDINEACWIMFLVLPLRCKCVQTLRDQSSRKQRDALTVEFELELL